MISEILNANLWRYNHGDMHASYFVIHDTYIQTPLSYHPSLPCPPTLLFPLTWSVMVQISRILLVKQLGIHIALLNDGIMCIRHPN